MTTIVAFSDLHGNTPALRAFLAELDGLSADVVVNLGDIFSGGVDPAGTRDLLRRHRQFVTIRGNHERQLLERVHHVPGGSDWLAEQILDGADRDWMGSLPTVTEVAPRVLAFHGTPDDDITYLLETVDPAAPNGLREATDDEVMERLGSWVGTADVFLCGHTHLPRVRQLPNGAVVVNPGSLGWPAYQDEHPSPHTVESNDPSARFVVLESTADGHWAVTQRALEYPVEEAAAIATANGRPDVAVALRTGRMGVAA